jgi:tRNA 2-thiouridine synthesizing protein A
MSQTEAARPGADRTIDLRGDVCPLTFAKTKIALEDMQLGQVLRVLLDYEPATRNVPRSAEMYGDQVLHVGATAPSEWEVLIRKQVE